MREGNVFRCAIPTQHADCTFHGLSNFAIGWLVARLRNLARGFVAMLTACVMTALVLGPAVDGLVCGADQVAAAMAAASDTTATAADKEAGKFASLHQNLNLCRHGHCHDGHSVVGDLTRVDLPAAMPRRVERPVAGAVLASAELTRDKPPPRA